METQNIEDLIHHIKFYERAYLKIPIQLVFEKQNFEKELEKYKGILDILIARARNRNGENIDSILIKTDKCHALLPQLRQLYKLDCKIELFEDG